VATFRYDSKRNEANSGSRVTCPTCSYEITLDGASRLPAEFSVPCPNCGRRTIYKSADAHDPKHDAEATKTPRTIRFSTDEKTKRQALIRGKSWLNEYATWLMQ
jgi:uncharacterized Zn finger protein (UPF0148 family)